MCGINGYFQQTKDLSKDEIFSLINKMNNKIIHRGPDEDGVFVSDNIGLGMRRLSVIDLSNGKQPVYNEDRSLVVVFNGEIYNYKKLRLDLKNKQHVFYTGSDTEVIVHAYEEYGTDCFNKFDGMFSIAIYSLKENKLILARDRVGEKPLYYCELKNKFLFASELKSIICSKLINKKINKLALNQYLSLGYITAPLTIFEGVNKLKPGHYLEICKDKVIINQYWNVVYNYNNLIEDYNLCKKKLREALFKSVEQCMVSDVPIGAFLSGGIDSTIITGIMSKLSNKPIETFTICYKNNKRYDESDRASKSAIRHKTNHHLFYLEEGDVISELDKIISNIDEPFADSSIIPTYMVSKMAREHVKVILTGDAGDELFGGYLKYLWRNYSKVYGKIPKIIRDKVIKNLVDKLNVKLSIFKKAKNVVQIYESELFTVTKKFMYLGYGENQLTELLDNSYFNKDANHFIKEYYDFYSEDIDELAQTLYTDLKVVLEGDMLTKVDMASMLNSLETRTPMLGREVVELAARIPSKYKIKGRNLKVILKETFSDLIPKEIINAPKRGFGVPIGDYFMNELKTDLLDVLDKDFIEEQGIFNYDFIKNCIDNHMSFKANNSAKLWVLYVFQKWYNNYYLDN